MGLRLVFIWVGAKIFMPKMQETSTLLDKLIAPLKPLILRSNKTRNCPVLEDEKWITTGLLRVLSSESSSRGFLQQLSDQFQMIIPGSSFFKTLRSVRRLDFASTSMKRLLKATRVPSQIHCLVLPVCKRMISTQETGTTELRQLTIKK